MVLQYNFIRYSHCMLVPFCRAVAVSSIDSTAKEFLQYIICQRLSNEYSYKQYEIVAKY